MEMEELSDRDAPGEDGQRPRWGTFGWLALVIVAVLAGYLLLGRGAGPGTAPGSATGSAPGSAAGPAPAGTTLPSPLPAFATPGSNEHQYIGVSRVCPPVTDRRTRLTISFEVSNVSRDTVDITGITGVLPAKGLRPVGAVGAGGTCAHPAREGAFGLLGSQQTRLYTLTFALPQRCAAMDSVQVRIDFSASGFFENSQSVLETDLRELRLARCASPAP